MQYEEEEEEEEEEEPPTEYDEDGMLRTSLHSFSDVRIIKFMPFDPSVPGQHCHAAVVRVSQPQSCP